MGASRANPASSCRSIVEKALASGRWVKDGIDGKGHGILRHISSGNTVAYQLGFDSSQDVNGVRNLAKQIEKISGVKTWERSSRKPSKGKKVSGSGFSPYKDEEEQGMSVLIQELRSGIAEIDGQIALLDPDSRKHAQQARILVGRRFRLVKRLEELFQPTDGLL